MRETPHIGREVQGHHGLCSRLRTVWDTRGPVSKKKRGYKEAARTAQQIKALDDKPDDLSPLPRWDPRIRREPTPATCPLTSKCMLQHALTHIHTLKKYP